MHTASPASTGAAPRVVALGAACAIAVLWIALFAGGGALGLIGPDEPRYAAVAREMAESGDWVTPRLNGQPWFEKPILYYWGAALSFRLFGESEAAARLPSAFGATAAILALAWLARRLYGVKTAYALLLMLPTTAAAIAFARAASTDMLFTAALTLALVAALRVIGSEPRRRIAWVAAWGACLGLGVLAKGPAAVLLAGGSVALWVLLTRRRADVRALTHPIGIGAFAAIALPWYVLCAMRNPDFLRVFVIEHNVQRYLTPVFEHRQPFWYFAPVILASLLPWTGLLVTLVQDARRSFVRAAWPPIETLTACWALVPFVFFSLSQSKLPGYVLPVIPPLALLMARSTARAADDDPAVLSRVLAGTALTLVAIVAAAFTAHDLLSEDAGRVLSEVGLTLTGVLLFAGAGLAVAALALTRRPWLALTLTSGMVAACLAVLVVRVIPDMDAQLTPRAAAKATERAAAGRPIYEHDLDRAWRYGLGYYFRREPPPWQDGQAEGVVVTTISGAKNLTSRGYAVHVIERVADEAVIVTLRRDADTAAAP